MSKNLLMYLAKNSFQNVKLQTDFLNFEMMYCKKYF